MPADQCQPSVMFEMMCYPSKAAASLLKISSHTCRLRVELVLHEPPGSRRRACASSHDTKFPHSRAAPGVQPFWNNTAQAEGKVDPFVELVLQEEDEDQRQLSTIKSQEVSHDCDLAELPSCAG